MGSWTQTLADTARSAGCAAGWSFVAASTAVLGTTCIGTTLFDPGGRRAYHVGKFWARINMARMRCPVTAIGRDNVEPNQPYVVMSNHRSHLDVWAAFLAVPLQLRWVMKQELRRIPVFGVACERMGHIYVQRGNRAAARAGMTAAAQRIRAGTSVFFFAEGTRSSTDRMGPFKKGGFRLAIAAQTPILPIAISGTADIMPAKEWRYRAGPVTVAMGKPIPTEGLNEDDLPALMAQTREAIEAGLARAAAAGDHPAKA